MTRALLRVFRRMLVALTLARDVYKKIATQLKAGPREVEIKIWVGCLLFKAQSLVDKMKEQLKRPHQRIVIQVVLERMGLRKGLRRGLL